MKFNRRNFLWVTFGAGTAIAGSQEHLRLKDIRQQQEQNKIARSSISENLSLYQFLKRRLQIRDNFFSRIFQELWQEFITWIF